MNPDERFHDGYRHDPAAPVVDPVSNIDVGAETLAIIASAAYWYDEKAGRRDAIDLVVDGVTATFYRDEHDRTHVRIGGGDE